MEIYWLVGGVITGASFTWLLITTVYRKKNNINQQKDELNKEELIRVAETNKMLKTELEVVKPELAKERQQVLKLSNELTRVTTEYQNLQTKLSDQKLEMTQLNERFSVEFKNLANEILEEKSRKFTSQNKENIESILSPLKERIQEFQKRVEDTNKEGLERNASLLEQIRTLGELNRQITQEANNLTRALKADTKTQGNWGEVILERILEKSGLQKGREYQVQVSETTLAGKRYQPDVVVRLPENKTIVIDAKVSLVAYERFVNSETEQEQQSQIKLHLTSVKNHIKVLSEKNYQNLFGIDSLDFVLLFVPVEPAFTLAMQEDSQIFNEAYSKNIVIVSPTTLMATLRTIASIWKQEYQNRNAAEIARQGGALYDKFVSFTEDLKNIGRQLDSTQKAYSAAEKKLMSGKDNLIRKTEKIKELGAKASKQLNKKFLDQL